MADITAGMVKELRERTGLGMMECKKALEEAGGDMKKAEDLLRITSAWDEKAAAIDSVPVSLERTDIQVAQLVLAWLPVA